MRSTISRPSPTCRCPRQQAELARRGHRARRAPGARGHPGLQRRSGARAPARRGAARSRSTRRPPRRCTASVRESTADRRAPPSTRAVPYGVAQGRRPLPDPELPRVAAACTRCRACLFNHESPRRGAEFVSRKVSLGVGPDQARPCSASCGSGNLSASRDWGHATAATSAAMAPDARPRTSPPTTSSAPASRTRSPSCSSEPFTAAGLELSATTWSADAAFIRPAEVDQLCADQGGQGAASARLAQPRPPGSTSSSRVMVESDLRAAVDPRRPRRTSRSVTDTHRRQLGGRRDPAGRRSAARRVRCRRRRRPARPIE